MSNLNTDKDGLSQSARDLRDKAAEDYTNGNGAKAARFLTGSNNPAARREREEKQRQQRIMEAAIQLASQQQIETLWSRLDDVQAKLDQALLGSAERLEALEENAARLADGTAIFLDVETGRYHYADDTMVPDHLSPVHVPPDPSTRQAYQAEKRYGAKLAEIQTGMLDKVRDGFQNDTLTVRQIDGYEEQLQEAERLMNRSNEADIADQFAPDPDTHSKARASNPTLDAPAI